MKSTFAVRHMDLHGWNDGSCVEKCTRVYRAVEVDAELEHLAAEIERLRVELFKMSGDILGKHL